MILYLPKFKKTMPSHSAGKSSGITIGAFVFHTLDMVSCYYFFVLDF